MMVKDLGHRIGLARDGHLMPSVQTELHISRVAMSSYDLVSMACWFGLVTGLLEISQLLVRSWFQGAKLLGALQLNGNFTWMIPVANFIIFGAFGLILGLLGGSLDVLINVVHEGVELFKIFSDLFLDDFCDDRFHHPQQQRLGNVKEQLVIGLLDFDVQILDIYSDFID